MRTLSSVAKPDRYRKDDPDEPAEPNEPALTRLQGINRVQWDLRHEGAARPMTKIDAGDPDQGPLVLPGVYTMKLTIAGRTYTTRARSRPIRAPAATPPQDPAGEPCVRTPGRRSSTDWSATSEAVCGRYARKAEDDCEAHGEAAGGEVATTRQPSAGRAHRRNRGTHAQPGSRWCTTCWPAARVARSSTQLSNLYTGDAIVRLVRADAGQRGQLEEPRGPVGDRGVKCGRSAPANWRSSNPRLRRSACRA